MWKSLENLDSNQYNLDREKEKTYSEALGDELGIQASCDLHLQTLSPRTTPLNVGIMERAQRWVQVVLCFHPDSATSQLSDLSFPSPTSGDMATLIAFLWMYNIKYSSLQGGVTQPTLVIRGVTSGLTMSRACTLESDGLPLKPSLGNHLPLILDKLLIHSVPQFPHQ